MTYVYRCVLVDWSITSLVCMLWTAGVFSASVPTTALLVFSRWSRVSVCTLALQGTRPPLSVLPLSKNISLPSHHSLPSRWIEGSTALSVEHIYTPDRHRNANEVVLFRNLSPQIRHHAQHALQLCCIRRCRHIWHCLNFLVV